MTEDLLRRVLAEEAARIEVSPVALSVIRARIRRRRWRWIRAPYLTRAVTVVTAVVIAFAVGLGSCAPIGGLAPPQPAGTRDRQSLPSGPANSDPAPTAAGAPTAAPGPSGATGPSAPAGTRPPVGPVTARVAVYYPGTDPDSGLYREFRRLLVGDGSAESRIRAAVRELLDPGDGAHDPDYGRAWPAGARLRKVSVSAGTATVDLSGAAANPAGDAVDQAVQQLVWTVTAVAGITGVRLLLDGVPVDRLWGRADVRGVLGRAPAVDVLAPVWLISPQHGDTVGRTFEVHVAGIVAGATVHLRIRQDDRTVAERVLTLSAGAPVQGERKLSVTLDPGDYTLQAYAVPLAGGGERHLDDHRVTVG